jgi:hypothetical protein
VYATDGTGWYGSALKLQPHVRVLARVPEANPPTSFSSFSRQPAAATSSAAPARRFDDPALVLNTLPRKWGKEVRNSSARLALIHSLTNRLPPAPY